MSRNIFFIPVLIFLTVRCQENSSEDFRDINGNGRMEAYENKNLSIPQRAADLTERLSLEQKLALIVGVMNDTSSSSKTVAKEVVRTQAIPEFGIPSLLLAEGLNGLQIADTVQRLPENTFRSISFPNSATIASTWNMDLAYETGKVMGSAAMEYGVDILMTPVLKSPVDPAGGWNSYSYSEDPYLSGLITTKIIEGIQSNGVGSAVRTLASSSESAIAGKVTERALREIHLRGLEIAVTEALPWSVENPAHAFFHKRFPNDILRKDWQFDGFIMSSSRSDSNSVAQLKAGSNFLIKGGQGKIQMLRAALSEGDLTEQELNYSVKKLLSAILRSPSFQGYPPSNDPDLEKHARVSKQIAVEGIVLLKNQNTLPLPEKIGALGLYGTASYDVTTGNTGNVVSNERSNTTVVDALKSANYELDNELRTSYENYIQREKSKLLTEESLPELTPTIPEMPINSSMAQKKAATTNAAIITIGREAGENTGRERAEYFYFTESEKSMINEISLAYRERYKKVIIILHTGHLIDVASLKDKADAIVLAWRGRTDASAALADVLSGQSNPSGKLPVSLPRALRPSRPENAAAVSQSVKLSETPESLVENSIYVGYRYFSTFDEPVAYPFGYGLSYTQFQYSDFSTGSDIFYERFPVQVRITNTGSVPGKEIVQFYISAADSLLEKPEIELKKFVKTSSLTPKASEVVAITLNYDDLASFDSNRSAWVVEPGTYTVYAASSSKDLKLSAVFSVEEEQIIKKVSELDNLSRKISDESPETDK